MTGKLILVLATGLGAHIGWRLGNQAGIMTAYLASVAGGTLGLVVGRRWQKWLEGDDGI